VDSVCRMAGDRPRHLFLLRAKTGRGIMRLQWR
jgi:hypothetical protein